MTDRFGFSSISFAFHDPIRYSLAPSSPEAASAMAANQVVLHAYAGDPFMHDPNLEARLVSLDLPSLVIWGASDRIVDLDYGRRFARSLPNARFHVVDQAGHFPHLEQPQEVAGLIESFASALRR